MSSTQKFAMLASNEKFASSHADPLPFDFIPEKGKMITYKTSDGKDANAFVVIADKPTNNWLIVVHEWWGLNNYIKQEAEKLQTELEYTNVIAVDLYDQRVAQVAADAQKLMGELKPERATTIIKGAISYVGPKAKIYTIGWCMGGGWSMQASLLAGKQAGGCVMYYGMPETDISKLKNLDCDVLGIFGKKDQWINQKVVDQFVDDMKAAGKKLTVKMYDADHAFANPSNPHYDKEATADAHKISNTFLKTRMK
jgi:carboxymethylenebutenolidase